MHYNVCSVALRATCLREWGLPLRCAQPEPRSGSINAARRAALDAPINELALGTERSEAPESFDPQGSRRDAPTRGAKHALAGRVQKIR